MSVILLKGFEAKPSFVAWSHYVQLMRIRDEDANNSRNFNDIMLYFIMKDSIYGFERGVPCDYKYSR